MLNYPNYINEELNIHPQGIALPGYMMKKGSMIMIDTDGIIVQIHKGRMNFLNVRPIQPAICLFCLEELDDGTIAAV